MYAWIWRRLPGDTRMKVLGAAGLVIVAGAVLWFVVFPWLEPRVPLDRVTVGP
ncbi:LPXTG cell wall anchor domain-containing protein [Sinosporangium siamense]|uniref:LPXTG cell wall anchor domain-containing protein n=1 Tax=Sinosporangium siamense TaxID=1367973 RepID=UPI0019524C8C|nr:LPXTG cell wall anchor domain-containing protein [Sinosporangium siamense]